MVSRFSVEELDWSAESPDFSSIWGELECCLQAKLYHSTSWEEILVDRFQYLVENLKQEEWRLLTYYLG